VYFQVLARPPDVSMYPRLVALVAERNITFAIAKMWETFIKGIGSQEMIPFVAMHPRIPCALSEHGFQQSPQDYSELSRPPVGNCGMCHHALKLARFTDAAILFPAWHQICC